MSYERYYWYETPLALLGFALWVGAFFGAAWLANQLYVLARLLELAYWFS